MKLPKLRGVVSNRHGFFAEIDIHGYPYQLGQFPGPDEAAAAYDNAAFYLGRGDTERWWPGLNNAEPYFTQGTPPPPPAPETDKLLDYLGTLHWRPWELR